MDTVEIIVLSSSNRPPRRRPELGNGNCYMDLFPCDNQLLAPRSIMSIRLGMAMRLPVGTGMQMLQRAGYGHDQNVFRGCISIFMPDGFVEYRPVIANLSGRPVVFERTTPVVQILLYRPVPRLTFQLRQFCETPVDLTIDRTFPLDPPEIREQIWRQCEERDRMTERWVFGLLQQARDRIEGEEHVLRNLAANIHYQPPQNQQQNHEQ